MSLLLTILSVCQAQARAAALPAPAMADAMDMADCHGAASAGDAAMGCHGVCEHLAQHNDAAKKLPLPDVTPVLLAIALSHEQAFAAPYRSAVYQAPERYAVDPPAAIRFQRFLN